MVVSGSAAARRQAVLDHLGSLAPSQPALIIGDSLRAARSLVFDAVRARGAAFGWQPTSLDLAARRLAAPLLAERSLAPVSGATMPAMLARVVATAGDKLGRYAAIAGSPGLPGALARTLAELRMAEVSTDRIAAGDPDLAAIAAAVDRELERLGFADRASIYKVAIEAAGGPRDPWRGAPVALVDLEITASLEGRLIAAIARQGGIATAVRGDRRSIELLEAGLGVTAEAIEDEGRSCLASARRSLFSAATGAQRPDGSIEVFSAPSESRECVELARRILELDLRFDQIAVLLRAPGLHRAHLVEAFGRAGIPAYFARGTTRPNPAGRALLTLLDCADEGLSARAFAEYLSLSVAPAPRRWERFIVDAAVIGGIDRWRRRLGGWKSELGLAAEVAAEDDARRERIARDLESIEALEARALPILEALEALPAAARWSLWLERLRELCRLAIGDPDPVLAVLAALEPMGPVGPVSLLEVRAALAGRLEHLIDRPAGSPAGKVFVGTVDDARGLVFEAVFAPGLAETVFPPKLLEDPILLDRARAAIDPGLPVTADRVRAERTRLQIAVGAPRRQLFVSYARLDGEQARPRVPSFYGLEILRAAEGSLPGFKGYAQRAHEGGGARMGWPAPADPAAAIDETEYDLAVLERLLHDDARSPGAARYLLETNEHLARALRFRARRWTLSRWTSADGLIDPGPEILEHLRAHRLEARAYSATALQRYGACPYRFYLHSLVRLSPREKPAPLDELGPLERGSLIHEIQFRFLRALGGAPISESSALLDRVIDEVAAEYREALAPAVERVWNESIDRVRRDLGGWLERLAASDWAPVHFELAFGLASTDDRDPHSRPDPVKLDSGLRLRGAVDLVERDGSRLRATDNKTGRSPGPRYLVIGGGQILQPALYAMALEKLFPGAEVTGGRLYYCTERGEYAEETVALDDATRDGVALIATSVDQAIERGFLPAFPDKRACAFCDYLAICGPYEELRTERKDRKPLEPLLEIRRRP